MSSGFQQQSAWDVSWLWERESERVKTDAKKSKTWVFSWAPHVVKVLRENEREREKERERKRESERERERKRAFLTVDCNHGTNHILTSLSHFLFLSISPFFALPHSLTLSLSRVFIHTFWWDPAEGIWNWSTPQSAHISIICLFYGFPYLSLPLSLSQSFLKNKIPLSFSI